MINKLFYILFFLLTPIITVAQETEKINHNPKLVVGIIVDQMRYDYLTRFYERFGDGGFKRLIANGYNCKNTHYNYVPTYTGPGHASVYTGTTPESHGIIANDWYDKFSKKEVYCASDPSVKAVGSDSELERMSPHRMKTSTVTDQNRLHTQLKGKTIGIAIKDRGAILPAGHAANGAYWFRGKEEGNWITSTYYRQKLPKWVEEFNNSGKASSYLKVWSTLYDINSYTESAEDNNTFEGTFKGKDTPSFPYDLAKLKDQNSGFDIIKNSPFGNSLTTDFAIAAIEGEDLGKDEVTDFLTVSFSSTDYVGHRFGVNSKEIQDTYLRLDQDLERFLKMLDKKVGKGKYTLFLTADHGAVQVPSYLQSVKVPAGYFETKEFAGKIKKFVQQKFKVEGLMENMSNNQIFFNYQLLQKQNINPEKLQKELSHFLLQQKQIDRVYTRAQLGTVSYTDGLSARIQKGFNQKRSGDVIVVLDPATIIYSKTGSTHGSGLLYDTHVPLLFFGNGIKKGSTTQYTDITDVAPTISALLGISFPNGNTGTVLPFVLDE